MENYLVWKENRATDEERPDSIARQYRDRVAFTVTQTCGIYCRHCFRKELVVDGSLAPRFRRRRGAALARRASRGAGCAGHRRRPVSASRRAARLPDPQTARAAPRRNDPLRYPHPDRAAAAHHPGADEGARRLPQGADLDQHPVQPPQGADRRDRPRGLRSALLRHQRRQPGGTPQGDQRRRRNLPQAAPAAAGDPDQALLRLLLRSRRRGSTISAPRSKRAPS